MQNVNTLTMSVEDTGNATALVKRLDDGRVLVVHDSNFGHDLDTANYVEVLLYAGTREWQDSGFEPEAGLTIPGPGHAVLAIEGATITLLCRRPAVPSKPATGLLMSDPTHVVVDCGYVFWKDADGRPFDLAAAVRFAADRNDGQREATYRVMALAPVVLVDVAPTAALVNDRGNLASITR